MDDEAFIKNMQKRIEESTGVSITLEFDHDERQETDVFSATIVHES